jgi:hypothetical protein
MSSSAARTLPAGHATFTDREQEVLEMLAGGRSNKEIGAPTRHRRAHRESPRSQTSAQDWRAEPHRAFGTCRYAFPGFLAKAKLKAKGIPEDVHEYAEPSRAINKSLPGSTFLQQGKQHISGGRGFQR